MLLYRYLYDDKKIQFVGPFSAFSFTYELKTAFFCALTTYFWSIKTPLKAITRLHPKPGLASIWRRMGLKMYSSKAFHECQSHHYNNLNIIGNARAFPIIVIYYFSMQKCLKILFSVSWLLICPPVISPNSSSTILRSSAMMSPLIPMSIDSKTRARDSSARSNAS